MSSSMGLAVFDEDAGHVAGLFTAAKARMKDRQPQRGVERLSNPEKLVAG